MNGILFLSSFPPLPLHLARVAGGFFDAAEITEGFQQGLSIESAWTRYAVYLILGAALLGGGLVCWRKDIDKRISPHRSLHVTTALIFPALVILGVAIPSLAFDVRAGLAVWV